MFIPLTIAGIVEGTMDGEEFYAIRDAIRPYLVSRAFGGVVYAIASVLFAVNIYKVIQVARSKPTVSSSKVHTS